MSFSIGENVGRYRITEQLGQGGMATVYRAFDANLDRDVAIKVMHQAFKEDPNFLARFKREAQIIAKLRHAHIVTIHEFDQHKEQPYLVMEFIKGETLKARLTRSAYTLEDTVTLMRAVADALTYAHDQGVLHRDIKPSNIMLDEQSTPYLTDFGLARMVQAGESTLSKDMMLGTPQYISPEQAQGIRDLGPATDIYSLGIVLYQLLVGRVPFSADTPYAIIHDHIYKPLPLPSEVNPSIPPAVERVLLKTLAKEPADRFQSATDMAQALQQSIQDNPVVEYTPQRVQAAAIPATPSPAPPTPGIPAVALSPATTTATQPRGRSRATLWMLGGIGAFIFTCLLGLFVAVAAVTNPNLQSPEGANFLALDQPPPPTHENPPPQRAEIPVVSVEEAQRMVDAHPDDPVAHLALVLAYTNEDQRPQAQQAIGQALQLASDDPMLLASAAQQFTEQGHIGEAVVLWIQALRVSDDPELRNMGGQFMYQAVSQARRVDLLALRRLVENNPENPGGHVLLARAYITTDQLALAEQSITTALELEATLPEAHLVLGELYAAHGDMAQAEREWRYVLTATDVPLWVTERANALLNP